MISNVNMCNNVWYFTFMRIKIYELTCKRRLQWKKIEILSEGTICQSQHFLKNLSFYSSGRLEKCWWHARLKNLRFEKKLEDELKFWENINLVAHFLRKTQIFALGLPNRIFSQIWYFSENLPFYHQTVPPNIFFPKLEKIFDLVAPRPKFEFFSKTVPPN